MTDTELLTEYLNCGSEECFSELVRHYMGLVFGTALRAMRNPAAAEEISQQVFCALARQARGIRNPAALATWLHHTTQRTAMMHLRSEQRRLDRERAAAELQELTDDGLAWEELAPALDTAMSSLKETDRAALLLRFFQSKPMAEVAVDLGVSESAAKMRIGRAIEKLRDRLSKLGVACSSAGLLALMESRASAHAVPAALERIVSISLVSLAAAKMAPGLAKSALGWPSTLAAGLIVALVVGWVSFSERGPVLPPKKITAIAPIKGEPGTPSSPLVGRARTRTAGDSLRLTTLDATTGQPLAGVIITASNLGKRLDRSATDRDGHCILPRPSAATGDFYYYIRTESAGYVSMEVSWSRFQSDVLSDIPTEYVLRIPPGARVGGSVVDNNGHPVPDVAVRVRLRSQGAVPPREEPFLMKGGTESATTDRNGKWFFDRLPPHWNAVHFIVSTPEYQKVDYVTDANDESVPKELQIPLPLLLDERAVLTVQGGFHVAGLILNTGKEPIPGASLVQDFHFFEPWARSSVGFDGSFEILNAQPGPLKLLVQAPNYAPQLVSLELNSSATKTNIVLEPGAHVQGQIVDGQGTPIPDAEVEVAQSGGTGQQFEWNIRTDPHGYFSWDSAPVAGFDAVVSKTGFESKQVFLKPGAQEAITLSSLREKMIEVQGIVLDDQNQQPISVFRYSLSEDDHGLGPSKQGQDGTLTANVSDRSKWFTIEVNAAGYEPASLGQRVSTNDSAQLTFQLHRASGCAGVVLLPNGEPAAEAEVGMADGGRSLILGDRRFLHKDESIIRQTDASGRFQFQPRPPQMPLGRVLVAIHAQGYAECEGVPPRHDITLRLQPWGQIKGILRCEGQPLANEPVFLQKRGWNPWLGSVDLQGPFWMNTDAAGQFYCMFVPPGDYAIGRQPAHSLDVRATVQVHRGAIVELSVGGTGRPVLGRIVIPDFRKDFDFTRSSGLLKRQQSDPVDLPWESRSEYPNEEAFQAAMVENGKRRIDYWQSEKGLAAWRQQLSYGIRFDPDGTFRANDVLPGDYILDVTLFETRPVLQPLTGLEAVHLNPSSDQQTPANLGTVILKPRF